MNKLLQGYLFLLCFSYSASLFAQDYKDCDTAFPLCGTSPFHLSTPAGIGEEEGDMDNTCLNNEYNSIWVKWTIQQGGLLTFELKPDSIYQDLDFYVFQFNTSNTCEDKELIRCMSSGENVGAPLEEWEVCIGATGLLVGETDTEEGAGCAEGNNNYLAPIEALSGDQYLLLINNFPLEEAGFELSFGGTAILDCIVVPVKDLHADNKPNFVIRPSISNGLINLKVNEVLLGAQLSIHQLNGLQVFTADNIEFTEHAIDLSKYANGIYIASIRQGHRLFSSKFLIQK